MAPMGVIEAPWVQLKNGLCRTIEKPTVPIRLTQTPTRYRTPSSDGGKRTRKQFLVSDLLISDLC